MSSTQLAYNHTQFTYTDCWPWTGTVRNDGYGQLSYEGKIYKAHRWSYEIYKGPIPEGLVIDHLCRNKLCTNPDHLEAVTQAENVHRGNVMLQRTPRTHCLQGHQLMINNIYIYKDGFRRCRQCRGRHYG